MTLGGSRQPRQMVNTQLNGIQRNKEPSTAFESKQPHAVSGKLPSKKGPADATQQLTEYDVAACPGQEDQQHPGLLQKYCGQQDQGRTHVPVFTPWSTTP